MTSVQSTDVCGIELTPCHRQEQSETAYLRQEDSGPNPESVSGVRILIWMDLDDTKFNRDFLVQSYICGKNFHEDPSSLYRDTSQIVGKCHILQC